MKIVKYICFRFDIDTHTCLTKGVPNLLDIFREYDARCTFFVSMGTAFNRSIFFKEYIKGCLFGVQRTTGVFSMSSKLGLSDSINTILFNPVIGSAQGQILHKMIVDGHELGLHGGKNHASWEKNAKKWKIPKITAEIQYGLDNFKRLMLPQPVSFASPCWQSPKELNNILLDNGFSILADTYSTQGRPYKNSFGLIQYPVNLLAKQPTVGFIENLRALGYSSNEIISEFEKQLNSDGNYKMVFDHPFYAGVKELDIISKMLEICVKNGYRIESLKNISKKISYEDFTHLS